MILAALLTSVLAALMFGLIPLRQVFKTDPNETIKSGGSRASAGRRWALRDILLAAHVALCCLTLTAAFVSLRGPEPGRRSLDPNHGRRGGRKTSQA